MTRRADQFRRSDVTQWALVATIACGLAVVAANARVLLPAEFFDVLHGSFGVSTNRADPAPVNALLTRMDALDTTQQQLRQANLQLAARFNGLVETASTARNRLDTLEGALPKLLKAAAPTPPADNSLITGAIGQSPRPPAETFDADGGSVSVTRSPLSLPSVPVAQPLPPVPTPRVPMSVLPPAPFPGQWPRLPDAGPVQLAAVDAASADAAADSPAPTADVKAIGVAIGKPVDPAHALAAWQTLVGRLGKVLVGASPLLAQDPAGSGGKVLVAGPLANVAAATKLCAELGKSSLTCTPMPYVGTELPPAR